MRAALRRVGLEGLLARAPLHDPRIDWGGQLSRGEQQRVALARLLFLRPPIALLDEATASVPEQVEAAVYGECVAQGMTLISVGHRSSLRPFHTRCLHLHGGGGWEIQDIDPAPALP
mmetsp:Transcript_32780/g.77255  ORF Transcript_32780/g.77255 Transcript_32780/m.77255 type:complete len:117 (+) Transcript_32780:3-353(+)